jgi:hypothetical protein
MTGIKWRRRVIFDAELNSFGRRLACDFGDDAKSEIDTRGYTAPRNYVAIVTAQTSLVKEVPNVRFGSLADICTAIGMSALPPRANIDHRGDLMNFHRAIVSFDLGNVMSPQCPVRRAGVVRVKG